MSSLVADYGNSSESDSSDEIQGDKKDRVKPSTEAEKLPLPKFGEDGAKITNSVFKNPFAEEEIAKSAILEKHVKMIPAKEDITQINGKQICWMYRKGRCRFGHNCKFAHDSDLYSEATGENLEQAECSAGGDASTKSEKVDKPVDSETKKKKRPGLTQGLVPGKKVMNMYKKQKVSTSNKV
ncbi:uncharacterized protein LOC128992085 [Macrosteles quadrilineatus]|uniref:uncharacterized protein LOC128992085 n=1 Tax=Macrosteles quadrilineatus TaxID=74068 RepID=UPI0023E190D6|nr:uncharacterized protein LOC128992085 [Macrosteles quadrilineatus]